MGAQFSHIGICFFNQEDSAEESIMGIFGDEKWHNQCEKQKMYTKEFVWSPLHIGRSLCEMLSFSVFSNSSEMCYTLRQK